MTLQELWMIIRRAWKLIAVVTLACMIACGGYYMIAKQRSESYSATSYIVANSNVSHVKGLADDEARKLAQASDGTSVQVKAESDTKTMTVTIAASSSDPDACVAAANVVAQAANEAAEKAYSNWDTPYSGSVTPAEKAEAGSSKSVVKYLLVGLLGGLFVSICIVVVLDMSRRPVKTPEGVQELVELPVLEILPAKDGERLLANVRFAGECAADASDAGTGAGKPLSSVLVVPAGDGEAAGKACELLSAAASAEGTDLDVKRACSFSEGMSGAYAARDADAVVVTARQWVDTLPQLESTVAELRLAGVNLAGIVFSEGKLG